MNVEDVVRNLNTNIPRTIEVPADKWEEFMEALYKRYVPPRRFKKEAEKGELNFYGITIKKIIVALLLLPVLGFSQYLPEGKKDTVSAVLLITDWDEETFPHKAFIINGYVVRQRLRYHGMPTYGEGMESLYKDIFQEIKFLDYNRKPLGTGVIVWDKKQNYKREY